MSFDTQNQLLLSKLMEFYKKDDNLDKMLSIINGSSKISLRIVDWFSTNYSKKNYTVIINDNNDRLKVYNDYKLKLKAYSKKRFDPFCRWQRITIPYNNDSHIQTTIGQLNFFKWALEKGVIKYIEKNYDEIDSDMNTRVTGNKMKNLSLSSNSSTESCVSSESSSSSSNNNTKTRKKREELSLNASRSIKKEDLSIVVSFN
tara:strand:- start:1872 stop:2477 length:606 start_codon:yes stop_codon:yes gene_type:complete